VGAGAEGAGEGEAAAMRRGLNGPSIGVGRSESGAAGTGGATSESGAEGASESGAAGTGAATGAGGMGARRELGGVVEGDGVASPPHPPIASFRSWSAGVGSALVAGGVAAPPIARLSTSRAPTAYRFLGSKRPLWLALSDAPKLVPRPSCPSGTLGAR
jgi:hypothetical protein